MLHIYLRKILREEKYPKIIINFNENKKAQYPGMKTWEKKKISNNFFYDWQNTKDIYQQSGLCLLPMRFARG